MVVSLGDPAVSIEVAITRYLQGFLILGKIPVFLASGREHMDGRDQYADVVVVPNCSLPEAN